MLARVVDAKDPAARRHSERVAAAAGALAAALGWPEHRIAALHEAAVVHDVGKVGVPDAILLKRGALTDDEREAMRGHAALGAEIVEDVLAPDQVRWVRHHHEAWDGSGYPDGLAGGRIPDGARVIAVADAWDAMTGERPYGRRRTPAEALAECRRGAGAQFDPDVVAALERVVDAGLLDGAAGRRAPEAA